MNRRNTIFRKEKMAVILLSAFFIIASAGMGYGWGSATPPNKDKDLIIQFDFKDGTLKATKNEKHSSFVVNKGQNVIFKIININRLAYQATINGELVTNNFNTTAPGPFSLLKTDEKKEDPPNKDSTLPLVSSQPQRDLVKELKDTIDSLKKIKELHLALTEILNKAETFTQLVIQRNKLCITFLGWKPTDRSPINSDVTDGCNGREKNAKELIKEIDTKLETHADLLKNIQSLADLEKINTKLENDLDRIKKEIEKIKADSTKKDEIKKKNDEIKKIGEEIKKNLDEIKNIKKKIEKSKEALVDFSKEFGNLKELIDNFFLLKNWVKEFDDNKYTDGIKRLLDDVKEENFSVSLTVPTVEGDEVKFTVKIEPTDKKNGQVLHQLKDPVIVLVKGGWLIDFSTGVFFNVDAHDQEYWLEDVETDDTKVKLKTKEFKSSISPIIGAMMHIYPRQTSCVKWSGFAFGLGTGSADKLSYYFGTGLMFGSKNRFLINIGATAVKIERLLPKYMDKINHEIDRPADDASVLKARYKVRFFLSLTYNLGK